MSELPFKILYGTGYTFTGKGKNKSVRAQQFLTYIDRCVIADIPATKKGFIYGVLGKSPKIGFDWAGNPYDGMHGYLSTTFRAMVHAGIVTYKRQGRAVVYSRGPNAKKWEFGPF